MKKIFVGLLVIVVLYALVSCFGGNSEPPKNGTSSKPNQQTSTTEENAEKTYGFDQAWYSSTKRERMYYLYDSKSNILVSFSNKGKTYFVRQTEGNLSDRLYIIDPETNERAKFETFKKENGEIYQYTYDYSSLCSICDLSSAIKILTKNTDFASTYKSP